METTLTNYKIIGDQLEVGTRPHWDASTDSLYYVDVPTSYAYKYQPSTGKIVKTKVGNEPLGFFFPASGAPDKFIASLGRRIVIATWNGESNEVQSVKDIGEVDTEKNLQANRLNGGKVDPLGRLWAGSMGPNGPDGEVIPGKGSLFSVSGRTLSKHASGIGISNGLAWNIAKGKMYYIDTLFPGVYQYDFNSTTGNISNKTVIFDFNKFGVPGLPDGLVIDTEGKLWVAAIWGSRIIRVDPDTQELLHTYILPTPQITALCFGNDDLSTLYVTTAKMEKDGKVPGHPAGCTLAIDGLGYKGLPGDSFKM